MAGRLTPSDPLWIRVYAVVMGIVVLGLGVAIGVIGYQEWQTSESLVPPIGLALASVMLMVVGVSVLLPRLPDRAAGALGVLLVVSVLGLLGVVGVASLVNPDQMVTTGPRGPHTPSEARIYGAVLLGILTVVVGSAMWGLANRSSRREARRER